MLDRSVQKEHDHLKRAADASTDEPPKKRRRLPRGVQGVHARDMSLVTPENASTRGGWRVTPTGRLIRPMRMRPAHPLPEPLDAVKPSKEKTKSGKTKTRMRQLPTRARRKTIDPTKWGSQQLKGIFLENAAVAHPTVPRRELEAGVSDDEGSEDYASGSESGSDSSAAATDIERSLSPPSPISIDEKRAPTPSAISSNIAPPSAVDRELAEEKSQSLGLLQSLFGDKDEWGGVGDIDSDLEEEMKRERRNADVTSGTDDADDTMDVEEQQLNPTPELSPQPSLGTTSKSEGTKSKLKDLFAPREEEGTSIIQSLHLGTDYSLLPPAGFSLLGHLDLDLELDDDVPFDVPAPVATVPAPSRPTAPIQPRLSHAHITSLDNSRPFFFPTGEGARRSVLDPTNWRTWFYRTDSPEAIRARWEETKGELTAGWKRRHREAIKSRRRRGGGVD